MKERHDVLKVRRSSCVIIVLLALVLVTGCTGGRPTKVDANNGITINSFVATPTSARDGEFVLFEADFENTGGTTAKNVQVDLFGVEGQWRDRFGNLVTSTLTQSFGTLRRPVPERSVPGDFRIAQFDLITKDIPEGISPVLPIEARVTYDYNTSGHLQIFAMSEDEYRRKINLGEQMPAAVIINSAGPIKLSIPDRFRTPIIVNTATQTETVQIAPFRIEFANVGSGFPITPDSDGRIRGAGGRLTGTIELFGPAGVEFDSCLGVTSGRIINLDDSQIPLQIRDSGSVPVACSLRIDKSQWNDRPVDTIQLVFNIFYRYYTFATVNVQVIGE